MPAIKVVRLIKQGGFGEVYEAIADGRQLAQKVFRPTVPLAPADLAKFRQRFLRELRVQKELNHENIMPIVEEVPGDPPSFLMPLGIEDYEEQIKRDRGAGAPALKPLLQILAGLEELHRLGYVHRDLKPANVLLVEDVWKLSDFGLAMPPPSGTARLTGTHSAWGTQEYAAPEQAHAFREVTSAADIFSFGCILHDIVGTPGRVPYARATAPGPVGAIIERCTERDPDDRFPDVSAIRIALLFALDPEIASAGAVLEHDAIAKRLKDGEALSSDEWEYIVRTIEEQPDGELAKALMLLVGPMVLATLSRDHPRLFERLVPILCTWMSDGVFSFDYCDVLATRLRTIAELGNVRERADATMAALRLGCSHNRWSVMRVFESLVQPGIPSGVADRIAVDLLAEGERSIDRIRQVESAISLPERKETYDPRIVRAIEELDRRYPDPGTRPRASSAR